MLENICAYLYEDGGSQCNQPKTDGDDMCIFHSLNPIKNIEEFKNELNKKTDMDFEGYVFPIELDGMILKNIIAPGSESSPGKIIMTNQINFKKAIFLKGITLSNILFKQRLDMAECTFLGICNFSNSEFKEKVIFSKSVVDGDGAVLFDNISIDDPNRFEFQDSDLGRWSFIRTDISKLNFIGCCWGNGERIDPFRIRTNFALYNGRFRNGNMLLLSFVLSHLL